MLEYTQEQKKELSDKILMYLDGWKSVESLNDNEDTQEESTDLDIEELFDHESSDNKDELIKRIFDHVNKRITMKGLLSYYESSLRQALSFTKQKKEENIRNMDPEDQDMFYQGVYKLTASNLWRLYNPRVNTDGTEDDWKDSYAGILYFQARDELIPFKIEFNSAACYISDE